MVTRWLLGALAAVVCGPAHAAPDWRRAGGDIFADVAALTADPPSSPEPAEAAVLPLSRQPYEAIVLDAASRHRIDPRLLHALVIVESAYHANAVSPAGAGGLTQLMPRTARSLGIADRFDPAANLAGGADYLARQILRFGDIRLALAAYNAGPARVARLGRVPDIAETQAYVAAVLECYLALSAGRSVRSRQDCRSRSP